MNKNFSFIILTFNEEVHLPRLLRSIQHLNVPTFILDSGSTDHTIKIAHKYQAKVKVNKFINHPRQWDFALNAFDVQTPWIIGLDADQTVTPELFELLSKFDDDNYKGINGIYFNRKNFFQGNWIRFGGYYPLYLLKMFRTGIGYSDLSENMDHRFIVPGKTIIWKKGHILEENLKENDIGFWLKKHKRYSDLIALEEIERKQNLRLQTLKPNLMGNPDERKAWLKRLWWQLPLGLRPYLYYIFRMIFQLGFLDSKTARRFHYLQGFWFRRLIDQKIKTLQKIQSNSNSHL